jgi:AbrB family looped-hinge helix DNA binding protein
VSVTVSEKGWIVIPADRRKKYNLHPGAEISVVDYGLLRARQEVM